MTVITQTSTSVTVDHTALAAALESVLPAVLGKTDPREVLKTVHVELDQEGITFVATNTYAIVAARIGRIPDDGFSVIDNGHALDEVGPTPAFNLARADVASLIRQLKAEKPPRHAHHWPVVVALTENGPEFRGMVWQITPTAVEGEFVRWQFLVGNRRDEEQPEMATDRIAFSGANLSLLAAASKPLGRPQDVAARFYLRGNNKPAVITLDGQPPSTSANLVILMPCRISGGWQ
jgi:hypothetical protein